MDSGLADPSDVRAALTGYDAPGEMVTFEVAPDGRVTAARFAMEPIYPVSAW